MLNNKFSNWEELYENTKKYLDEKDFSPFIHGGVVAAAVVTDKDNVYYGINIDSACGWGVCAERNAIFNMFTNGENIIKKVLAVDKNGVLMPCGVCREVLMQLDKNSGEIDVLVQASPVKTIKLKELLPNWWANDWFNKEKLI